MGPARTVWQMPRPQVRASDRHAEANGSRRNSENYLTADQRLSNELDDTTGCAPDIVGEAGGLAAAVSAGSDGFSCGCGAGTVLRTGVVCCGLAAACRTGIAAAGTGFGSAAFAAAAGLLALVALSDPPKPMRFARLPKKPLEDDALDGPAEATRVAGGVVVAGVAAGAATGAAAVGAG